MYYDVMLRKVAVKLHTSLPTSFFINIHGPVMNKTITLILCWMTTIITRKMLLPNLILPLLCKSTSEHVDKDRLPIIQDIRVVEFWNI